MGLNYADIVDCIRHAGRSCGRDAYFAKTFIHNPYDNSVPEAFEAWADGYAHGVAQAKEEEAFVELGLDVPANQNDPNFDLERYMAFTVDNDPRAV